MKIQFAFLSLFLATAHTGHEPKGLRGRSGDGKGDDQDVDKVGFAETETTTVSMTILKGSSVTINCFNGDQKCCVTGTFVGSNHRGYASFASGSGGCDGGITYTANGSVGTCESTSCSITCNGSCSVSIPGGSSENDFLNDDGDNNQDDDNNQMTMTTTTSCKWKRSNFE